jgi:hypothetical protein
MTPHPATIQYIRAACKRPGMYMGDYDLTYLEAQLHGFDAGLAAAGALGQCSKFNVSFREFVTKKTGLSGSLGWAAALIGSFGTGKAAFNAFCDLLSAALPVEFDPATFDHE